jgi:hypothetical protein
LHSTSNATGTGGMRSKKKGRSQAPRFQTVTV